MALAGFAVACAGYAIDQAHKYYMLHILDIGAVQPLEITSFFFLVLAWNTGVSYGLLGNSSEWWPYLLTAFACFLSAGFAWWLITSKRLIVAVSLGLIIGGALSNATDRMIYGAVADFFYLSAYGYSWYIFNLADCWITFGAVGLIWDTFSGASDDDARDAGASGSPDK